MREAKRSRKRKRKAKHQDSSQTSTLGNGEKAVNRGKHPQMLAAPESLCNLTEYRGSQLCKLCTLKSEINVSMEEALHCVCLAIVAMHVKVLAKR